MKIDITQIVQNDINSILCFADRAARYICVIKNQLDALFILSLFRQLTSTCFGHIYNPSGGLLCIYNNWYCMLPGRPTDSHLKSTTRTNCCIYIYIYIYTVYLLMMG